jgi:hypothetical protein
MGIAHNLMALELSSALLSQLRTGQAGSWATDRLSENSILWQGIADWPRPDVAFEDQTTNATFALEFKPPNQTKREYVTGLGQMITYLADFEFAGLVLPAKSDDGFEISHYVADVISKNLDKLPIALFSYDKNVSDLSVLRKLQARQASMIVGSKKVRPHAFWAYWRDLSNFDLLEIMRIIDADPYSSFAISYDCFWENFAAKGKARTWEGEARKRKNLHAISKGAERLNARLAMRQTGLLGPNHRLTSLGLELLRVGKIYGADSIPFLNLLARFILIEGRHLDLIFWIEERGRLIEQNLKNTSRQYFSALDEQLIAGGVIAPREPDVAKIHYIRDEPKLWNKLGLLKNSGSAKYFHNGIGFVFDWRKIISVVGSR